MFRRVAIYIGVLALAFAAAFNVYTTPQLVAASPSLPEYNALTGARTHALQINNQSDSVLTLTTFDPPATYTLQANYSYDIPVNPNASYQLRPATNGVRQTTTSPNPSVTVAEGDTTTSYSAVPLAVTTVAQPIVVTAALQLSLTTVAQGFDLIAANAAPGQGQRVYIIDITAYYSNSISGAGDFPSALMYGSLIFEERTNVPSTVGRVWGAALNAGAPSIQYEPPIAIPLSQRGNGVRVSYRATSAYANNIIEVIAHYYLAN